MTSATGGAPPKTAFVVVDASLAIKWVLKEDLRAEALALLSRWDQDSVTILVPSWFSCEIANVMLKRMWKSNLTLLEAQTSLDSIASAVVVRDIEPIVAKRGLEIAWSLGRPASYDSHYVAMAEHLGIDLWTADERYYNAASPAFPFVKWLGSVVPPAASAT
jgi:predicted nucleic acid-binding protein